MENASEARHIMECKEAFPVVTEQTSKISFTLEDPDAARIQFLENCLLENKMKMNALSRKLNYLFTNYDFDQKKESDSSNIHALVMLASFKQRIFNEMSECLESEKNLTQKVEEARRKYRKKSLASCESEESRITEKRDELDEQEKNKFLRRILAESHLTRNSEILEKIEAKKACRIIEDREKEIHKQIVAAKVKVSSYRHCKQKISHLMRKSFENNLLAKKMKTEEMEMKVSARKFALMRLKRAIKVSIQATKKRETNESDDDFRKISYFKDFEGRRIYMKKKMELTREMLRSNALREAERAKNKILHEHTQIQELIVKEKAKKAKLEQFWKTKLEEKKLENKRKESEFYRKSKSPVTLPSVTPREKFMEDFKAAGDSISVPCEQPKYESPKINLIACASKCITDDVKPSLESTTPFSELENQSILQSWDKCSCPFDWLPKSFIFKDYKSGTSYRKKIRIWNRSLLKKKFYFLQLFSDNAKLELSKMLKVNLNGSMELSPGLSTDVEIEFECLDELLQFQASLKFLYDKQATFDIPILGFPKKAQLKLSSNSIKFENVIFRHKALKRIKIENVGLNEAMITSVRLTNANSEAYDKFLDTPLTLKDEEIVEESENRKYRVKSSNRKLDRYIATDKSLNTELIMSILDDILDSVVKSPLLAYSVAGIKALPPGESIEFEILFRPSAVFNHVETVEINYNDSQTVTLPVKANSISNPIEINPLNINMDVCITGNPYQINVTVSTKKKTVGTVKPSIPKALEPYVNVFPKKQILSNQNAATLAVRFLPTKEMLTSQSVRPFYDPMTHILDFEINLECELKGLDQIVESATFMAVISSNELDFNPAELNFGFCTYDEIVKLELVVTNKAIISQNIGFLDLPECLSIEPSHGMADLLPSEKRPFQLLLSLSPEEKPQVSYVFKCCSLQGADYTIRFQAFAKDPIAKFSHRHIYFPLTDYGSTKTAILTLSLDKAESSLDLSPRSFFFPKNPLWPFKIEPRMGYFQPAQAIDLKVEFTAEISEEDLLNLHNMRLEQKFTKKRKFLLLQLQDTEKQLFYENANLRECSEDSKADDFKSSKEKLSTKSFKKDPKAMDGMSRSRPIISSMQQQGKLMSTLSSVDEADTSCTKKLVEKRSSLLKSLHKDFIPVSMGEPIELEELAITKREYMQFAESSCHVFEVPCFISGTSGFTETITMMITCPSKAPALILLNESNTINFCQTTVYHQTVEYVNVYSVHSEPIDVSLDVLDSDGPFVLLNAPHQIPPEHVLTLKFAFIPTHIGRFEESIYLCGGSSSIKITLLGESVPANYLIVPNQTVLLIPGNMEIHSVAYTSFEIHNKGKTMFKIGVKVQNIESLTSSEYKQRITRNCKITPSQMHPQLEKSIVKNGRCRKKKRKGKRTPSIVGDADRRKNELQIHDEAEISELKYAKTKNPCNFRGPFIAQSEGFSQKLNLNELIEWMSLKEEPAFCQPIPSSLLIEPNEKKQIKVYLVPQKVGYLVASLGISLCNRISHQLDICASVK